MKSNQYNLRELEAQYLKDYQRGLLTKQQLLNLIHRLDRMSAIRGNYP